MSGFCPTTARWGLYPQLCYNVTSAKGRAMVNKCCALVWKHTGFDFFFDFFFSDLQLSSDSDSSEESSSESEDDSEEDSTDDENDEPLSLEWPETRKKQAIYLFLFPIVFPLWSTIPDVRNPVRTFLLLPEP